MTRLRSPAISHTTTSMLWALLFAVYIFIVGMALGWTRAGSFVVAAVAGFGIFLFVRFYGEDDPRQL